MCLSSRQSNFAFCGHVCSGDLFDVDEYERRVEALQAMTSMIEMNELVADLEPGKAMVKAEPKALERKTGTGHRRLFSVFGGSKLNGTIQLPARITTYTCFGGSIVDLREATFEGHEITIHVRSIFGGVTVIVPPDVDVHTSGLGLMGSFDTMDREAQNTRARVNVKGLVLFGGVDVQSRQVGESRRQARKRRKKERKKDQRLLK